MATQDSGEFRGRLWLCLVVASGVVVAGGLWYCGLQPPTARYQGKTSAQWFREFRQATSRHWTIRGVTPSGNSRSLDLPGLQREPAANGLRALGTNAAVYLGREFARKDGVLARTYGKLYFRLSTSIKRFLRKPSDARGYARVEIGWALQVLGPEASAAAPSIITVLGNGDQFTVRHALGILRKLEFDRHELDPLLEDWSKGGQHTNIVLAVAEVKVRTAVAARGLGKALSTGNPAFRRSCAYELGQFGAAGVPAVRPIMVALKDPDDQVRYEAARALEAIGNGAGSAIPALRQATNDASVMVQRASVRALRVIQGQPAD